MQNKSGGMGNLNNQDLRQYTHPSPAHVPPAHPKARSWHGVLLKSILLSMAAVFLFGTGFLVGDDRIRLNTAADSTGTSLVNSSAPDNSGDLSTSGLQEIYDLLRDQYDGEFSDEALLDGLKSGTVAAVGDAYTEYLNEEDTQAFNEGLDGEFEGIGAELDQEDASLLL